MKRSKLLKKIKNTPEPELLAIVNRWILDGKNSDNDLIYPINDEGAFALFCGYQLGYFDPHNKYICLNEFGEVTTTNDIFEIVNIDIFIDDLLENNLVSYYFGE